MALPPSDSAVPLAAAFVAYQTAYRAAAQAVHDATPGPRGLQDGADLEHAVGPERVALFLYQRLIALGAERVVVQPGALAPADATRNKIVS